MEKIKLNITTVTPVTIGSGAELSPYSDYVIDNEQVCFIDKKKMQEKILQKGNNCLDFYVQGVAMGMDNTRSTFNLKSFLINNRIVENIDEIISCRWQLIGKADSKLPIKGLLKTPLQEPYFSGSTIKGALKTVLMYNWLKTNKKADETIEKVINGGSFDFLEKQFEYKEDETTRDVIRKNTIQQVTDSSRIAKENVVVVDCFRKMPIRFECIAKGKSAGFELTLEKYKWKDLVKQANDYAFDSLNRELDLVERNGTQIDYFNQSADIQDLINEEIGKEYSDTFYLRLGFGKGYYLNSLGIAIYDYVNQKDKEDLYNKFEEFIKKQFPKSNQRGDLSLEDFPKTRLFVTQTQEPLGWVKIEKNNL